MTKDEREVLNKMSLETYGVSNRWKKMMDRGVPSKVVEQYAGFERTYNSTAYLTLDEVKKKMEKDLQAKREEEAKKEAQKKRDEELRAKNSAPAVEPEAQQG